MVAANPSPRSIATHVEYVVVSDGPYRLHTLRASVTAKMRSTKLCFSGSPARLITRAVCGTAPTSISAFIADGTVLISVTSTRLRANSSAFLTIVTVAPTLIGTNHSYTAKSKFSDVENSVCFKSSAGKEDLAQLTKFTVFLCSIATPLGWPVDPDV